MKIGLISDTHDNIGNILKAVIEFNDGNTDIVLHAGDFVTPSAIEPFAGVKLVGVLGNNDVDILGLRSAFEKIDGELKEEFFETTYDGMTFALYHGTDFSKRKLLANSGKYDVFIHGHTHRKVFAKVGKTIVINPGTANGWFFGYNASIGIFDTQTRQIEFINL
ncbi:MAG TPA: metallophosphoesterase [Nitrososphaeraceae archaeon]